MRRALAACAAAGALAGFVACAGLGGLSGGLPDAGADANGADAAGVDGCPGSAGPQMVAVDAASAYCVDGTEVTNAQYGDFLVATAGDAGGQPAACSWNTAFAPSGTCTTANTAGDAPVACVNWCDAYAYCAWAGKRLCGKIGGGPSSQALLVNGSVDQWYRACSADGARVYCYGAFDKGVCNIAGDGGPKATGFMPFCEGGYKGIFQMNGNVAEWEDACDQAGGATDLCALRGGSYVDDGGAASCPNVASAARNAASPTIGFRCCSP